MSAEARDRAYGVLCSLVLEDGSRWGESAVAYQRENALAILDVEADVRQHWLTLPRGARKTTDLAGILLAVLATQAPARARAYVGASDEDQARELVDAAAGLIARTPELAGLFEVTDLKITHVPSGAALIALPMDASAMGKRAWMIVLDEVANWPDTKRARRFWGVVMSGNRKLADCRSVVITNAGFPEHWAARRRETAIGSRFWRVSEVPGPLPWLSADDVEVLRENAETPSEFDRLVLNRWVAGEDALASRAVVEACSTVDGRLEPMRGFGYVIGLDLAAKRDNAVAVVAHYEPSGAVSSPGAGFGPVEGGGGGSSWVNDRPTVVVDVLQVWTPTDAEPVLLGEVEEWVRETARRYRARVVADPWQALGMIERLERAGIRCTAYTFSQASAGKLGVLLHGLLRDRGIRLPVDEELADELSHVRLRRTGPGAYRLDHDHGRHDDRAVAIALAAQSLVQTAPRRYDPDAAGASAVSWDSARPVPGGAHSWDGPDRGRPRGGFSRGPVWPVSPW